MNDLYTADVVTLTEYLGMLFFGGTYFCMGVFIICEEIIQKRIGENRTRYIRIAIATFMCSMVALSMINYFLLGDGRDSGRAKRIKGITLEVLQINKPQR